MLGAWRTAMWLGLTGMLGSIFWFTAFTLQNAAYVLPSVRSRYFSLVASYLFFRRRWWPGNWWASSS